MRWGFITECSTFQVSDVENFITENLAVQGEDCEDGEESEKSFFAECKHKHGPHGN